MTASGVSEFPRPVLVRTLRGASTDSPREISVTATEAECARIAQRLGLPDVASLSCRYELFPQTGHTVQATGSMTARLSQLCVLTLEVFEDVIAERFVIRFVPASDHDGSFDENGELDEIDDVPYDGDVVDLGEAAVEQLSLILDPYPRRPGVARPAAILTEEEISRQEVEEEVEERPNPFAALAKLKRDGS
ncbi:YceD family protein [Acetobacter sp.]|uniref:YceD family protein n=1 Tax=Acetobacter sp. TaxID=440 RepID=UPI0025C21A80|nr:DUF177 domain-containing protein [Acetobacter sp.]MCH4091814.1 DUF177 domain-containing protein [Acetobacter sp.]MCI1300330.1 DUF177 domain-containing protein [Acetobacter sp.]MCI1316852.1 DUF177 domain-containing protein [Acetobacter sp.]